MKKNTIAICLIIAALAYAVTGCGTIQRALLTETVSPVVTNAVSGDVSGGVTNYAPNPVAVATAQTVAALPFPFAGTAGIALGWLITAYASIKNKRLASALVTGIDAGRQILQTTPEGQRLDAKFKDMLIQHQDAAGVLNEASKLVNKLTGDTVKTA